MTATTTPPKSGEQSSVGDAKLPNISWTSRALHLFALTGLAVVQPLLGLLGAAPDFWVARRATHLDVALVVLVSPSLRFRR